MARCCRVTNKDHHGSSGNRLISTCPGMAKVTPDLEQAKAGVRTFCFFVNELQVRLDDLSCKLCCLFIPLSRLYTLQFFRKVAPVAHEREDRDKPSVEMPS